MLTSHSLFCSHRDCHKLAWRHCAGCNRPVCSQHAHHFPLFSGDRWLCERCRRQRFPFGKDRS